MTFKKILKKLLAANEQNKHHLFHHRNSGAIIDFAGN